MKKRTVIVVSHAHLDREWYFPFQYFEDRLERIINAVLVFLSRYPDFRFLLDGQVIPIMDYLRNNPEKRKFVEKHVKEGRLVIGPAYILPDEFLVPGEVHIKNLEMGMKIAKQLGRCHKIGYFPDAFGHVSQMPQIFTGFGLRGCVLWRGVDEGNECRDLLWIGADSTRIRVYRLDRRFGYSNAKYILFQKSGPVVWNGQDYISLDDLLGSEFGKTDTDTAVLMNGDDHTPVQSEPNIVKILHRLNRHYPGIRFRFGTFEDYFRIRCSPGIVIKGEQNSCRYAHILKGTYSSRLRDVKQRYYQTFNRLIQAEFLGALSSIAAGFSVPRGRLESAWEFLLQNSAHDSICGCSIDQVHEDMQFRFSQAGQIADKTTEEAVKLIAGKIESGKYSDTIFIAVNTTQHDCRNFYAGIDVPERFHDFEILDRKGRKVNYVILGSEKNAVIRELGRYPQRELLRTRRLEIFAEARIPAFGYSLFYIRESDDKRKCCQENMTSQGERYRIKFKGDGTFSIHDTQKGISYRNLHRFTDIGDRGDEYNFCPVGKEVTQQGAGVKRLVSNSTIELYSAEYFLKIPAGLQKNRRQRSAERVTLRIRSRITLNKGNGRVDIRTEFHNNADDHRLRVVFPSGISVKEHYAAGVFDTVCRSSEETKGMARGEMEERSNTHCHQGFFCVHKGSNGLAVISATHPDYEVKPDGRLELTLVRSVGWLSLGDLSTRRGDAGPEIETPDSQERGRHVVEYCVIPFDGNFNILYSNLAQVQMPVLTATFESRNRVSKDGIRPSGSIMRGIKNLVVTSVYRRDNKVYVRLFNLGSRKIRFNPLKFFTPISSRAEQLYLDERVKKRIRDEIEVNGKEIVTLGYFL